MPITTLRNPHLDEMESDYLYHLGINIANSKDSKDIVEQFGDVRFVCMGGTKHRMAELTHYLRDILDIDKNAPLTDLCEHAQRYAVYKVGPVLCASHGVGMSTMSVVLHELLKLVRYAKCQDVVFIRIGTCGGLALPPGSVVISEKAYNGLLRNEHEIAILGKSVKRPAYFDKEIANEILNCAKTTDQFTTVLGNTMAAECFYEGQGRLDGASCDYDINQKMKFLKRCSEEFGIKNIEMEATMFSSLCLQVGVRAADVCVTLLNRLEGDQVKITPDEKHNFEMFPLIIIGRYIKKALSQ